MLTKEQLIAKSRECSELANDPATPDQYRTYLRLEAQHWRTKAHNPERASYLEIEDAGLIWLMIFILGVVAAIAVVLTFKSIG